MAEPLRAKDWLVISLISVSLAGAGVGIWLYYKNKKKNAMLLSKKSINFIIAQEISSLDLYNRRYTYPSWPKGDSGVTIGIGYDLGYHSIAEINRDWADLPAGTRSLLVACAGVTGDAALTLLQNNKALQAVVVPYNIASDVFIRSALPKAAKEALGIYPGLEQLLPDAAGAIVSMVFNRGDSLVGERRTEMKQIVPLVKVKDYTGIANLIDQSKRLWQGIGMDGLVKRREQEAALVRGAVRQYASSETLTISSQA